MVSSPSFVAFFSATLFHNYFSLFLLVPYFMICIYYSANHFPTTLVTIVVIPISYNLYSFIFKFLYINLSLFTFVHLLMFVFVFVYYFKFVYIHYPFLHMLDCPLCGSPLFPGHETSLRVISNVKIIVAHYSDLT